MGENIFDSNEHEKLIEDFLEGFSFQDKIDKKPASKDAGLNNLSLDDYDDVEEDQDLEHLDELQNLIRDIEKKDRANKNQEQAFDSSQFRINYPSELNAAQWYAVANSEKPLLVIAGAGSGKTRTIVYRVSYLLEKGVDPANILLLTFTRKAAGEMLNRCTQLLGNNHADRIMAGTFHAFANYCLRKYANFLKIPPRFTIIDTVDSRDIVALIRDEMIKKRDRLFPNKNRIYEIISKSRNCRLGIDKILEREYTGLLDYLKPLQLIAQTYQRYKKANFLFDYDDLLEVLAQSLKENKAFRQLLQKQYQYVLVDEYQDTNIYQKEIACIIAASHKRIMVVGDDSQSIYSFRGANYENILSFPADFPACEVVKIEQNYRSSQKILDFTNSLIEHAKLGYKKKLFSSEQSKLLPDFQKFYDAEEESVRIVDQIIAYREKGIPLKDMAVLVRAAFHANHVQTELIKRNIPYVVVGGIRFTERRHIRDMIAFLRLLLNPYDASSWHRILQLIYGIGDAISRKIIAGIRANDGKLSLDGFKNKSYYGALAELEEIYSRAGEQSSVLSQLETFLNYYKPILKKVEDDYEKRLLDVDVLISLSKSYNDLEKFLSDFTLDPPSNQLQDSSAPLISEQEEDPLVISTIHSAKGLEWQCVFLPHLLDGLFPGSRSLKNIREMEEERRLFYVAATRAKAHLHMSMPSYFNAWEKVFTLPSRFLVEIDKKYFKIL